MSDATTRPDVRPSRGMRAQVWLTEAESGRRNRRTVDGILVAGCALAIGGTALVAASAPNQDDAMGAALVTVLGWAPALWRTAVVVALSYSIVTLAVVVADRRWALARDLLVALVASAMTSSVLGLTLAPDGLEPSGGLFTAWGFPELRVAGVATVLAVAGPELVLPVRRAGWWILGLSSLGVVALGAALPSETVGGLAVGLGTGALVRLAFGSVAGVPLSARVAEALAALGVDAAEIRPAPRQHIGAAEYVGRDREGGALSVRVLGRDAQDTQRLARQWRTLAFRDPPRSVAVGRLEQVEHEALATLLAAQAGVRVHEVVTAALGPDGDALVVTRRPDLPPLEECGRDQIDDATLRELWVQVARLHAAGISHGRLNTGQVVVDDKGPTLVGLAAATLGAPQSAIDMDVAELLVSCTVLVGPDRALRAALDCAGTAAVTRASPYLQRAALTPHLRDLARSHEVALKDLREAVAKATGSKVPEIAALRRVRPRDFLVTAVVAVAAYLLISQLAEIGFDTIAEELRSADPGWLVLALVVAQLSIVPQGVSLRGAVLTPLPVLPCVVLQSAVKFVSLTVPGPAGRVAINVRFLQRMGAPPGEAVAASAVERISETVVEVALILVTLPLVDVAIETSDLRISAPDGRLVAAVAIAVVVGVAGVLGIPSLRAKVLPTVRSGLSSLRSVMSTPHKRLELFGGNIGAAVFFALTLGAVCHAYGVDLTLAQLLFVNLTASALARLIPSPGGVGAAEATLTAGLVAMGVDQSTAFAIAIAHRLCTNYLPPIWGYWSLQWLRRKAYV